MKKICLILVGIFVVGVFSFYWFSSSKDEVYTYEWVEERDSAIGQYRLFINDSRGRHVDGVARLVFINGKTARVSINKEGVLYVKSVVSAVRNPKKRG